jgi:formylmethanofuran dehydrogenase subunit C
MSLTLTYFAKTSIPVEVDGVLPDRLAGKSLAEIERLKIAHGNRQCALADLFSIAGDASDGRIDFEGNLAGVHHIGAGMTGGEIRVHGDAGRHIGREMAGGRINVEGSAGDWLGGEMHGGLIEVAGNAGDHVGSAYRGSKRGMTDGTILIGGNAGDEIGATMRRGTVVVGGSCGDALGFNMIAGSILVFGTCGIRPGANMRRGTIGLLGAKSPPLLPTFRSAGRFRPLFLRLLFRELARLHFPVDRARLVGDLSLFHGDMIALGKGEVWISNPA